MVKNVIWLVLVSFMSLLQMTCLEPLAIGGVLPDLTVLMVVFFALIDGEERAMFTGTLGGLFQDVAGDAVLGHHVLGLVIVGFVVARINLRLVTEHPAVKAGLVFGASMGAGLLYTAILYVQDPIGIGLQVVVTRTVPGAFYTAMVTPLLFWCLQRIVGKMFIMEGTPA